MDQDEDLLLVSGARTQGAIQKDLTNYKTNIPQLDSYFDVDQFRIIYDQCDQQYIQQLISNRQVINRFSLWRFLLGVIKAQTLEENVELISQNRALYNQWKAQHIKIEQPKRRDPLSKQKPQEQAWGGYFENAELKTQINKDVERTYSDKEFFQNLKIKNLLTNILFVWSKNNIALSYRQGMNEVAASVIYAYFQEVQSMPQANDLLDLNYVEEDIYFVFDKVMTDCQHMETFRPSIQEKQKNCNSKKTQILTRIQRILDVQLKIIDFELFKHFKLLNVEPQIFLLRWIRCLFTREFHLIDSLQIWDNLFLDYYLYPKDNLLNLIECITIAMMMYVRTQMLEKDEGTDCLQRCLKYPPVEDLSQIIDAALEIRGILQSEETESDLKNAKCVQSFLSKQIVSGPQIFTSQNSQNIQDLREADNIQKITIKQYGTLMRLIDETLLDNKEPRLNLKLQEIKSILQNI